MKIAIPRERRAHETRVAVSPEAVMKFVALGCEVVIEKIAGAGAAYTDAAFKTAGAAIAKDAAAACNGARMILKVQRPEPAELGAMPAGAVLVAMLDPHRAGPPGAGNELQAIAEAGARRARRRRTARPQASLDDAPTRMRSVPRGIWRNPPVSASRILECKSSMSFVLAPNSITIRLIPKPRLS